MTRSIRAPALALSTVLTFVLTIVLTGALVAPAARAAGPEELDGIRLDWLPSGLGTSTDFTYEFDDVAFRSRDWESRSPEGGWRVDMSVDTLRGEHLGTARELHDWFIAYQDRPSAQAQYVPTSVHGHRGWIARDEIFWWVRPGFAMAVRLDAGRWAHRDLVHVARAACTDATAPIGPGTLSPAKAEPRDIGTARTSSGGVSPAR